MKKQKISPVDLDSIFDFDNEEQKMEFEEMVINSDAMQVVQDLMDSSPEVKTKAELAKRLKVTPAYISKLFSGDKFFNVNLLMKIQRIFNMRFKVVDSRTVAPTVSYAERETHEVHVYEAGSFYMNTIVRRESGTPPRTAINTWTNVNHKAVFDFSHSNLLKRISENKLDIKR